MSFASMVLTLTLPLLQDTEEARRAIAVIKSVNGNMTVDAKAPGKPVIGVNL